MVLDSYTSTVGEYRTYPLGFTHAIDPVRGSRGAASAARSLGRGQPQIGGDAPAPLATTSHAHWHAAARRRRSCSWLILRTPLRMPSAPFMTQAAATCAARIVRDEDNMHFGAEEF